MTEKDIGKKCLVISDETITNDTDSIIVNPVGDGNCIFISNYTNKESAVLDFGGNSIESLCKKQLEFVDIFILSHYHSDHYNGLVKFKNELNNKLHIKELYYPILPEISDDPCLLHKFIFFAYCLGDESGCPEYDLSKLIQKLNQNNQNLKSTAVSKGDIINIGSSSYEVIWPPKQFSSESNTTLSDKINNIRNEINKNASLKVLWDEVDKKDFTDSTVVSLRKEFEEKKNDLDTYIIASKDVKLEKTKKSIIEEIRKVTNCFSICLFKKNSFLFLGDLEGKQIKDCLSQLTYDTDSAYIPVKYFITAHHGTHYHDFCKYIKSAYVISSNGKSMKQYFKSEYKNCGVFCHNTCEDGIFTDSNGLALGEGIIISVCKE